MQTVPQHLAAERQRVATLAAQLERCTRAEKQTSEQEAELEQRLDLLRLGRSRLQAASEACQGLMQRSVRRCEEFEAIAALEARVAKMPNGHVGKEGGFVERPLGLPNRNNDCFWLSVVQCLRHTPGFCQTLERALGKGSGGDNAWTSRWAGTKRSTLLEALAELMSVMQNGEGDLPEALAAFRAQAMESLPASDGRRPLVQADATMQRQQDAHEFLSQLLDYLGDNYVDAVDSSPRISANKTRLEEVERELTDAAKVKNESTSEEAKEWAKKTAFNLLYEYSTIQWASNSTRMKSRAMGAIFEGQRLASITCRRCGRFGACGAEPFCMEEVKLGDAGEDGWFGRLGALFNAKQDKISLGELLTQSAENPALEGYKCPAKGCSEVGSATKKTRLFRLPVVLIFHVNRAKTDGSRCDTVLEFEQTLDLNDLRMVIHFGSPLDRSLEPCFTQYSLYAAIFHRGTSATRGHYFAYVLVGDQWLRIEDNSVVTPQATKKLTPMALEASEPPEGARVALLFYKRRL